jgi:hypothetical protein
MHLPPWVEPSPLDAHGTGDGDGASDDGADADSSDGDSNGDANRDDDVPPADGSVDSSSESDDDAARLPDARRLGGNAHAARASHRPCPICKEDRDDAFHAFFECPNVHLVRARLQLNGCVRPMLEAVVKLLPRSHGPAARGRRADVERLPDLDLTSVEGKAVAYRLLCGVAYPARVVEAAAAPAAHLLGEVFDAVKLEPSKLRGTARTIVGNAATHTLLVADARRAALLDIGAVQGRPARLNLDANLYPRGARVSLATHDPRAYPRWRYAHHGVCGGCGTGGGGLAPCAFCDLTIHRTGMEAPPAACNAAVRLPAGAEWVCRECAAGLRGLSDALGHAPPIPILGGP